MLFRCPFVISTVTTRRGLVSQLEKPVFRRDLAPSEDYEFGAKLIEMCDFKNSCEPASAYRLHPGQLTDSKSDLIGQQMLKIQGTLLERLGIPATTENLLLHQKCARGNPESLQDIINARAWLEEKIPQGLAVLRGLQIADDDPRVNPNGGAIALGHPLGMTGARITGTVALELARTGGRYGLATMCVGVGQGAAVLIERV